MKAQAFAATSAVSVATTGAKRALDHVIASFTGDKNGPTLVAIGSLHGNEMAGALALEEVARKLTLIQNEIKGRVFLIRGNTRALQRGCDS